MGLDPVDVFIDRLVASEGKELFDLGMFGAALENQWLYLKMEHCIPMLGDAGAHVGPLIDVDSPTFLLSELTRNRNFFTLPDSVRQIASQSAGVLGLKQRGEIREGWHEPARVCK